MLPETLLPVDQQIPNAEFITPYDAYNQYCEVGGNLSLRAWVDAQNKGVNFDLIRDQRPPIDTKHNDPASQYLTAGGNIHPDLFQHINPEAFYIWDSYNKYNTNKYFLPDLHRTLYQYAPVSEEALILMEQLQTRGLCPPEEVRFFYYQLANLDPSLPAVGTTEQIHVTLGQIPDVQKLIDTSYMASALTGNGFLSEYAHRLISELKLHRGVQPGNLVDTELQIELLLMKGRIEEANALRDTLPKPVKT